MILNVMCTYAGTDEAIFTSCARAMHRMVEDATLAEMAMANRGCLLRRTEVELNGADPAQ